MPTFPKPHKLGAGSSRWALSELLAYEARRDGKQPPTLPPEQERFLSVKQVAKRYNAGVTTVWRWASAGVAE